MNKAQQQAFFAAVKSGKTTWITLVILLGIYVAIALLGIAGAYSSNEYPAAVRYISIGEAIIALIAFWGFYTGKKFSITYNYILGFLIVTSGNMTGNIIIPTILGIGILSTTFQFASLERKFRTNTLSPKERK
jgi:hypothetical protein